MMLRSRKNLADIYGGAAKRKMGRNRKIMQPLSEVHIEGRSTEEPESSVLQSGTSLHQASSSCDSVSNAEQSSSAAEHSAICQVKNSPSTEVEKFSSAVVPSGVTSSKVLSNCNQPADLQPSPVSEDCAVLPASNSSSQMLNNSVQIVDLLPSSVSEDSGRSLEREDSIMEVIPLDISDVRVLEIKSCELSSNDNKSEDADTSDIIIISDSPGKGSVGNRSLNTTPREVSQFQGKKRKLDDENGVEVLCDILGPRPKKLQKMGCVVKEKKLWTNDTIKKKNTVAVSDTDRKTASLTKNEKSKDVNNISSKRGAVDGNDVIFICADDDEVSVINTEEQHKQHQEDVIILDSPPVQSSTDKKPKKMVSTSVTGLIPHYTQHLIDYISLDGKPPATASTSNSTSQLPSTSNSTSQLPSTSNSTSQLPYGSSDRHRHEHIPVLKRRKRHDRFNRGLKRHSQTRNANRTVQSDCVPIPISSSPPQALAENQLSPIRNSTQNSTTQSSTTQNAVPENSVPENSVPESSVPENTVHSAAEVSQSPACPFGSNIYNPNAGDKEERGLRPVILDGNNIAMGHGKGKFFSWRGLHICIKFFLKRGHKVTAFVPTFRKGACPPELRSELDDYERSGQIVFTPSRRIEGRLVVPYDDRFIVQCAAEFGGVIVSTDNYRDLLNENNSWKETIEKRLLMFTWVGDLLMFPHDPLGRHGPQLEEFLRFPKK